MGNGTGAIPGIVIGTLTQANAVLGTVALLISAYKAARDAWRAAHPPTPDTPDGWLDDDVLIDLLRADSAKLVAHVDEVLSRHGAAPQPAPGE